MAALEILNVQKNYGAVSVIKGISLTVEPGEFTVLLGPSGCGKSTLLHALAGLEDIDAGTLRIGGVDVTDLEPKDRGIAMVFQSYALYPTMTVAENLSFGLRMSQVGAAEIASRIHEAARMLQIENLLDRKPAQLSGGQRQRVAIGRAIVRKVPVFLFDEPLSNLDAKLRTDMRVELKRLHAELGTTMVYVTHDQVEAMTMATRIAVLNGGLVEQYDTPQVLYDSPANMFVAGFVGTPPMNFLKGVMSTVECRAVVAIGDRMIDVSHYHCKARPNDGEAVFLGIRPEHLSITEPEIASAVPGDLISIEPLGSETLAWIATCDARLCVRLSPDRGGQIPSRMGLAISPSKISLFAATSGERI